MSLKIINSLTGEKEEFQPLKKGEVSMYVCGPTVYDEPHLGHLRSAYVFEVIRNYLEFSGFRVYFIRNVTDVDDKIIEKAGENKPLNLLQEVKIVSEKYYQSYAGALKALGVRPPDKEPRATTHVLEMIALIKKLLEKGAAYESKGDVYFEVEKFGGYGKLSHQKKEAMLEGARVDPGEKKKNPLDFALWKQAKEGEPSWPSPWGDGRPGWHIECSAMSTKYLGENFDIHGGGRDLIFPHHENEIAQVEAATGESFARVWVHHGLVTKDGQKMSKSLHNFVTFSELGLNNPWAMEELKLFFLGTHYSAPLDYSEEKMKMEKSIRERFVYFFDEIKSLKASQARGKDERVLEWQNALRGAMDDDFNAPKALSVMHEMMHESRKAKEPALLLQTGGAIREFAKIFGLTFDEGISDNSEIEQWVKKREAAKKNRDFKTADEIRVRLFKEKGVVLTDSSDGSTHWRKS